MFWAAGFWAPGFWRDNFWEGMTAVVVSPPGVGTGSGGGVALAGRGGRILDVGDSEYERKKKIEDEIHALFKERERKAKELKATEIKLAYEEKASLAKKAESLYRKIADIEIEIQKLRAKREQIEIEEMDEVMEVYMVSRMVH